MGGRVGKLVGGQVKLDKNKNNRIDAEKINYFLKC